MYSRLGTAIKRILDFCVALAGLILLSPLFLIIAILIKLYGGKGPVLFVQERATKGYKPFRMLKFRSMYVGAEEISKKGGSVQKQITPIGKKLRRIHFDDWPQLWNVLKGEMSLVGIRGKPFWELERLAKEDKRWKERHAVKAGMTSLDRLLFYVPKKRTKFISELDQGEKLKKQLEQAFERNEHLYYVLEVDMYYVKHCSLKLDFFIFFHTIAFILKGCLK